MPRQGVPAAVAKPIQRRLDEFLRGRYGSRYRFMEGYPATEPTTGGGRRLKDPEFSRKTVDAWFRSNRVPDVSSILRLAELARLSPSYLLLGDGDPYRGVAAPPTALGAALRRKLWAELSGKFTQADFDAIVGDAEDLVAEVTTWYGDRVAKHREDRRAQFRGFTLERAQAMRRDLDVYIRTFKRVGSAANGSTCGVKR